MQTEGLINSLSKFGRAMLAILISITLVVTLAPLPAHAADEAIPFDPDTYSVLPIGDSGTQLASTHSGSPTKYYLYNSAISNNMTPLPDNGSTGSYSIVSGISTVNSSSPCIFQLVGNNKLYVYGVNGITANKLGEITVSSNLILPKLTQTEASDFYVLTNGSNFLGVWDKQLKLLTTDPAIAETYKTLSTGPVIGGVQSYLCPQYVEGDTNPQKMIYVDANLQELKVAGYPLFAPACSLGWKTCPNPIAVTDRSNGQQVFFVQDTAGNYGVIDIDGTPLTTFSFSDYYIATIPIPGVTVLVDGQWYTGSIDQIISDFAPYTPPVQAEKGTIHAVGELLYQITALSKNGSSGKVKVMGPSIARNEIKKVYIPSTVTINGFSYKVTAITKRAFKKCSAIEKVTIKNNVKEIGYAAFYKCEKLRTVAMAASCKIIHAKAFARCTQLKYITIKSPDLSYKTVGKYAFYKIDKYAKVKVPRDQVGYYAAIFMSRHLPRTAMMKYF